MSSRRAPAVLVLLFALTWTACSSSSNSASTTTTASSAPTTTTTSTNKLANLQKICQNSDAELGAAAKNAFGNQQPATAQWQPFMVATVLPLIEKRLQTMKDDPAAHDPAIAHAIDVGNAAVISARDNPQQLSPSTKAPFDEYDSLVSAAGIPDCGLGG